MLPGGGADDGLSSCKKGRAKHKNSKGGKKEKYKIHKEKKLEKACKKQ